ncbi:MAG: CehA/McbA family metallohydrolase [Phenylobacterium sp.]|uniref:CehA/McbA family metallohydrolase n=1 Tax=Phenylobacterium sp. TaxID=1871053 RepID=UPI0027309444|nr:CehA/McbA family metallohydrolase [Phenylobacterium sp.]MDP1615925.1 CehA/McbA family metallohydrolase [Phenylobacterium sp.]MDP1988720.1 CehA/McbA family metallohydrolase [Phenylobacterium sp.]MDP3382067.1 CehA/McbA family metallohydrolase [Phenylobacterium sp.]
MGRFRITGAGAWIVALMVALSGASTAAAQERSADLRLEGELTRRNHETYVELPFAVPPGTGRLTVVFRHDGADDRTTIDLGLRDPQRLRGWSGGARDRFTVAETDATPAYLPGPLPAGTWNLILGVPNLRPDVTTAYVAEIWLDPAEATPSALSDAPLAQGPAWWRGDLHVHSGHSDGTCRSRGGARIPCPIFRIVETAAERGLDFIALTEHNAASQAQGLRELQPYFDDILLIPGRELTTFQGHANLLGLSAPLEFRLGAPGAADLDMVLDRAASLGATVSINHPRMPSGEACMGCGWQAQTDWSKVHAIEVLNGGAMAAFGGRAESPLSGIGFWESLLDEGHRLTAIGGSDSHDPDRPVGEPGALGRPATVIHAASLSQPDLMAGLRAGRVFIDLGHPGLKRLELEATAGGRTARMGDELNAASGALISFRVKVEGAPGARIQVVESGGARELLPAQPGDQIDQTFTRRSDGQRRWLRIDLRDAHGGLLALGNPIYLNWDDAP